MPRKKTDPNAGVTNALKLKFPQDTQSITPVMRREVARTIGRIKGDPKKMTLFKDTLAVLIQYSEDVFAKETARKKQAEKDRQEEAERKAKEEAEYAAKRGAQKRAEAEELLRQAEELDNLHTGNAQ